ncbi:hypothetical protein BDV25DRAFT_136606 [Aspergillus avenaceus]|uniref:Uncharacterized protein n=1 Tax=Aspergillus avenaceus TaxID=36643 RepID=A0A5N6U4Y9_ASPAV|nr:hypothetical protein BDV25DRAFT_136606 [Aspergillus avenaceus]
MSALIGLEVSIAPPVISASSDAPTVPIQVSVHNPSDTPVTFLNWGTPLDPSAHVLSVFEIEDTTDQKPVALETIKISRQMPPSPEDLVEIPAGDSIEKEVKLPGVPFITGHEYSIQAKGIWHFVWETTRDEVTVSKLEHQSDSQRGRFESNVATIHIE